MTIKREDVDHRRVDFRGVTSGQRLPAIHPGEILRDEFLVPMKITVYQLAKALKVSRPRLNDIVLARRAITTNTALRLSRYFGTTAEFWINFQTRYNLDVAEETTRQTIEQEVEPHAA
ncbi:MAG: HigA family addiction module antidote protein [Gammaproteobacteria bacterium]|nr:HigA family addiction module antidote protein [Gammaproteobacteria bacterium]MYF28237.1 HigA family addiction module antidote protein [Gammaproteobacteria bacterium]MYK47860.1 HigA family addiction module antidote protein [Gammaproteobacteria bacterium]